MRDLCLENRDIFKLVDNENNRQLAKWGIQDHEPFTWLGFATEELGELSEAISAHKWRDGLVEDVVDEAIQVATLCLKIAEMYQATLVRKLA